MSVIGSYPEVYSPRFFIEADGSLASDLIPFITKFEYEDEEAKIDKLTLTVANPGLRFKDDKRFQEGVRFRVRFGYLNDMSDMKNAIIAHARPHFGRELPIIEMVALNLQIDMNKKANPINWGTISSSDVARKIAKRHNLDIQADESKDARAQARLQPAGVTDIQYVMNLAQKLNWDCFIDGQTLHFHKKKYDEPATLEFVYFTESSGTLLKFEPDVNLTSPVGVESAGTNPKDAHTDQSGRPPSRDALFGTTKGQYLGVAVTAPSHETDPKVIAAHGLAKAQKVDMNAVKATAEIIGTPRVRSRTMIRISGVDQIYSGNWRVSKSKHTIEPKGVYRCSLNLKRDAGKANSKEQNKHDTNNANTADTNGRVYSPTHARVEGSLSPRK